MELYDHSKSVLELIDLFMDAHLPLNHFKDQLRSTLMRNNSSNATQPIFILSCSSSGSTLLRNILDTHPDICSPSELHLGRLCHDLRYVLRHLSIEQFKNTPKKTGKKIDIEVRQIVSKMMSDYTRRKGKQIWCEKAPDNLDYLDVLDEIFKDVKYICLHRHCMDRAHSQLSQMIGVKDSPAYYARNRNKINALVNGWADRTERLLTFERKNASKCFRIKYETLVTMPAVVLGELFLFLEREWDSILLDRVFTQSHDPGHGDVKVLFSKSIHTKSVGVSSCIPIKCIEDHLLQKMNNLLMELGYPIVGMNWAEVDETSFGVRQVLSERNTNNQFVSNIEELFKTHFPNQLQGHVDKSELSGVIKFIVRGTGGGIWLVDLTKDAGQIVRRDGNANTTIQVLANDLLDIVNGKFSAPEAFAHGKLKITGDFPRAIELGLILL